jgi:hypothetical protein
MGVAGGVAAGPADAGAVAGDEAGSSLGTGGVAVGASEASADDSTGGPATPLPGAGEVDWPAAPMFALATAGVPVAPATAPPNRDGNQITTARIVAATATTPRANGARRSLRRCGIASFTRGPAAAVATAIEAPHPGQVPPARLQHLSQA